MKSPSTFSRFLFLACGLMAVTGLQAQSPSYCLSSATQTNDEEIYNVMFNGAVTNTLYSFTNGCSTPAPGPGSVLNEYSNFKSLGTFATITQGAAVNFSVAENECDGSPYYNSRIGIWIDYNHNGLFTDAGEQIYFELNQATSPRNINGTTIIPMSALTGTTVMRVVCADLSSWVNFNPCTAYTYGETEDYVISISAAAPCSGNPASNTVVASSAVVCPAGGAFLQLANAITTSSINYQWYSSSTGANGTYSAIAGATMANYVTPPNTAGNTTWYQASINCPNASATVAANPIMITTANTVTNVVTASSPYSEGFENTVPGQLPNCSWAAVGNVNTFTTASMLPAGYIHAGFYYNAAGSSYVFSNGLKLFSGVVYSASILYQPDNAGTNWTNLSLLYGSSQTTTGLTPIASTSSAGSATALATLSNTFMVSTTGMYYMAVNAVSNGSCCSYNLLWDNLTVSVPCSLNPGSVFITASPNPICKGQSVALSVAGANTYTWSNASTAASFTASPLTSTGYSVIGTNSASGCNYTASGNVTVLPVPQVLVAYTPALVCVGDTLTIMAQGAVSYNWSLGGANGSSITLLPTSNITFTVTGTSPNGCNNSVIKTITVNPLPQVAASCSPTFICEGGTVTIAANGANTIVWTSIDSVFIGNTHVLAPRSSQTFTAQGVDLNGCVGTALCTLSVSSCAGLEAYGETGNEATVFPNPTKANIRLSFNSVNTRQLFLTDLQGRIMLQKESCCALSTDIDLSHFEPGVYFLKISGAGEQVTKKILKNQ